MTFEAHPSGPVVRRPLPQSAEGWPPQLVARVAASIGMTLDDEDLTLAAVRLLDDIGYPRVRKRRWWERGSGE